MLLTSSAGIEENPVITRHDDKWVLFTSVGWFGHCGYRTTWRRSPDFRDWSRARPRPILSTADGLCGPGGADVLQRRDGTTQLYFHGWTCYRGPYPCPPDWNTDHPQQRHGLRRPVRRHPEVDGRRPAGRGELDRVRCCRRPLRRPPPRPPTPTPTPT